MWTKIKAFSNGPIAAAAIGAVVGAGLIAGAMWLKKKTVG